MPIAHPASPGPLRQGDILKALRFYITGDDGAILEDSVPFCVVLSRDCNALRAETVVVAGIRQYTAESFKSILSGQMSLDEARRTMDAVRDGDGTPDTCYLGPLLDGERRYAVSLDRIHTIDVPVGDKRDAWIEKYRAFQLDPDFVRHLQIRLFASVAKQGFDDFTWWPKQDLEMLVSLGRANVAKLSIADHEARLKLMEAQQQEATNKQLSGRENEVKKRAAAVEQAKSQLKTYEDELARRNPGEGEAAT